MNWMVVQPVMFSPTLLEHFCSYIMLHGCNAQDEQLNREQERAQTHCRPVDVLWKQCLLSDSQLCIHKCPNPPAECWESPARPGTYGVLLFWGCCHLSSSMWLLALDYEERIQVFYAQQYSMKKTKQQQYQYKVWAAMMQFAIDKKITTTLREMTLIDLLSLLQDSLWLARVKERCEIYFMEIENTGNSTEVEIPEVLHWHTIMSTQCYF